VPSPGDPPEDLEVGREGGRFRVAWGEGRARTELEADDDRLVVRRPGEAPVELLSDDVTALAIEVEEGSGWPLQRYRLVALGRREARHVLLSGLSGTELVETIAPALAEALHLPAPVLPWIEAS
jgi:hypothetical protein